MFSVRATAADQLTCTLTFMLSYTAAAFSGSLLWCLKANSVSTIPGEMHCKRAEAFPPLGFPPPATAARAACSLPWP